MLPRTEGDARETCDTCRYYSPIERRAGRRDGLCRRHPPVIAASAFMEPAHFPIVPPDQWCGEYDQHRRGYGFT